MAKKYSFSSSYKLSVSMRMFIIYLKNSSLIKFASYIKRVLKYLLIFLGVLFTFLIVLSFTHLPYYQYYWLGTCNNKAVSNPDYIVLLGGGGMPSSDGLLKAYYTAKTWCENPEAKIIIAIPSDTCLKNSSPELQIKRELILRNVNAQIIGFEPTGYNTYTQASAIKNSFDNQAIDTLKLILISTPEHIYRSIRVFEKQGFRNVGGFAVFEKELAEKNLKKNKEEGRVILNFRYNIWSYLQYEIIVIREYCAIAYYKLRAWI